MMNAGAGKRVTIIVDEKIKAVIKTTTTVKCGSIVYSLDSLFMRLGIDPKEFKDRL